MAAVSSSRQVGRDMQPSQSAIEREFEALRNIRRRSSAQGGPGALLLDPDLPTQGPTTTPPLSPQAWAADDDIKTSPTSSREDSSSSGHDGGGTLADDPFHLFWVPAHLHPELAPSEFRAFLKEHARTPAEGTAGSAAAALSRASSSSSGLGRKRSMLSRQYKPRDNDGVEEEERVVPLRRNKSVYNEGPQLTISDLQKLEELADEDPTKLRKVIRRSLSLNVAPSFLDQMDDGLDVGDDADAPIIVPRPNQILRRSARTKIRKPGLAGDGGGHRFPATRRSAGRAASVDVPPVKSPSEETSSSHGEHESFRRPQKTKHRAEEEEENIDDRRMTYTEESLIYDAYADSPDEKESLPSEVPPQATTPTVVVEREPSPPPVHSIPDTTTPSLTTPAHTILHQPQPVRHLSPVIQQQQPTQPPSRTPSPEVPSQPTSFDEIRRPESRSSVTSDVSYIGTSPGTEKKKDKDKKSLWRKVGGGSDKSSKKGAKEKDRDKDKEKEKESGFFGSLFGGKKKHEDHPQTNLGGGAGPATAAAMLGASKSKPYQPSISPQLGNPYARYPIHVERAVYRLSHIKLANPRRPLYEQVLISNLMFWYLGVINKTQQGPGQNQNQNQQTQTQTQSQANGTPAGNGPIADGAGTSSAAAEKEQREREQQEREERERAERERAERERELRERAEPRREARRGSLTKPPAGGSAGSGVRRAEMPVRNPQYGLQSQVIEQEYRPSPVPIGPSLSRTSSAPPVSSPPQGYSGGYSSRPQSQTPKPVVGGSGYSQPDGNSNYYYSRSGSVDLGGSPPPRSTSPIRSSTTATGLPPGAMPPVSSNEQLWLASVPSMNSTSPRLSSAPSNSRSYGLDNEPDSRRSPPRAARSPPQDAYSNRDWSRADWEGSGGGKLPNRSLSANAAVPSANSGYNANTLKKKAPSAKAAPDRRQRTSEGGEEEDVPLAIWQQQRRK